MALYKKYRNSFWQRFGFQLPLIIKSSKRLVWLHAVSVGEAKAIAPLAKKMKDYDPSIQLIITSGTETGHTVALESIPFADGHYYLPLDFGWAMRRIMKSAKPDLLILCETDYWYNFLKFGKKYGASTLVVNGKISSISARRFAKFSFYTHRIFDLIDFICVQNNLFKERFCNIGVLEKKLIVTGNLKFDIYYPKLSPSEEQLWKQQIAIDEQPVLVIGSSHYPEEEKIIEQLKLVWRSFPRLKVLLVPRHPERFDEVAHLLERKKISFSRYSQGPVKASSQVILIDAMGLLLRCYQVANIAIVAGSFVNHVGGHNILEPCSYGVPVVFGPYMFSQPELMELALEYKAGLQVSIEQISATLIQLLSDPLSCHSMGKNGLKLIENNQGAVEKTWNLIKNRYLT